MERIRGYVTDILLKLCEFVYYSFIFIFYLWYWSNNYFEKPYMAIIIIIIIIIGNPFRKSHL